MGDAGRAGVVTRGHSTKDRSHAPDAGPKAPARGSRDAKTSGLKAHGWRNAPARWVLSAALVCALVAPAGTASASEGTFRDDDGTPYERAIEVLAAEGIVSGCDEDDDRYCPRDPVRRSSAWRHGERSVDPATRTRRHRPSRSSAASS
jgi:hypothetical protein